MKRPQSPPAIPAAAPIKRRGVLVGTGVAALAGVAAAAASRAGQPDVAEVQAKARQDDAADGYRLSDHVKRYYETIRV